MRLWHACLAILLWAASVWAQATGTLVVTVIDDDSGDAQEAALVYIPALDVGGMSDEQGQFTIPDVPVGEHEVRAELIGYSTATTTVAVEAGQTATVELRIKPSALLLEEVAVTGTAFEESPINLPYAVTVVGREEMAEQGSPQVVDFFKNLGASHGVIGEANSWYNAIAGNVVPETVANVNLRGLGASRTLVLLNGRRQTYVPARLIGGRFVDVNAFPSIAIDRIEVLKEGASAIYGSDAVAGVANFVTRDEFAGFEVTGSYDHFAHAGDSNLGAIWGGALGSAHAVVSVERMSRQELKAEERDWTLRPYIRALPVAGRTTATRVRSSCRPCRAAKAGLSLPRRSSTSTTAKAASALWIPAARASAALRSRTKPAASAIRRGTTHRKEQPHPRLCRNQRPVGRAVELPR